jgi:hypothetical protein
MFYKYRVMRLEDVMRELEEGESLPPEKGSGDRFDGVGPASSSTNREIGTSSSLKELREGGYRWVRTDGGLAIFEKSSTTLPKFSEGEIADIEKTLNLIEKGYSELSCAEAHRRRTGGSVVEAIRTVRIIAQEAGLQFGGPKELQGDDTFALGEPEATNKQLHEILTGGG